MAHQISAGFFHKLPLFHIEWHTGMGTAIDIGKDIVALTLNENIINICSGAKRELFSRPTLYIFN